MLVCPNTNDRGVFEVPSPMCDTPADPLVSIFCRLLFMERTAASAGCGTMCDTVLVAGGVWV